MFTDRSTEAAVLEYANTISSRMDGGEGRGALALRSPSLPSSIREGFSKGGDLSSHIPYACALGIDTSYNALNEVGIKPPHIIREVVP